MFLNMKRNVFQSMFDIVVLSYIDISVIYPEGFRGVKFVITSPCFV